MLALELRLAGVQRPIRATARAMRVFTILRFE